MPSLLHAFVLLVALAGTAAGAAERLAPEAVPDPLKAWIPWALHELPEAACPLLGDSGNRRCAWAGTLALALDDQGGTFQVALYTYAPSWVPLPGGAGQWPQEVTEFDQPLAVSLHDGRPAVRLPAGRHRLAGRYRWPQLPDALEVPPAYGMVTLSVGGQARAAALPPLDGKLWLATQTAPSAAEQRLDVQVFRQIVDELPLQVVTQLDLDVAGTEREVQLRGMQLDDSVPMVLDSPLPARLESDGVLRLMVRPGHWRIRLTARRTGPVNELVLPEQPAPWPSQEVWSFAARNALRVVEIEGGLAVDPRQTNLPAEWQDLPAWRLAAGEALRFVERRRGDPDPEPDQLSLRRELWLDFDGGGYTINDRIDGRMTSNWRLEALPSLALGQVLLDGEAQFITTVDGGPAGVEVRRGALSLSADSRYVEAVDVVPAVGWASDVSALAATLHLPPGWRLWSARGVDNVPDTWLQRWTLLDLFLVLIAAAAAARLWGRGTALLVLVTLTLGWHEAGAPRQVWLHLLAAVALLSLLPAGRLRWLVGAYRNLALLVLLATSVVFMVDQVRLALYPQLAQPHGVMGDAMTSHVADAITAPAAMEEARSADMEMAPAMDMAGMAENLQRPLPEAPMQVLSSGSTSSARRDFSALDPRARIQTGPGLPDWRWTAIELGWNGPVRQDQSFSLILLSPAANLALAFLRVGLLAALVVVFVRSAIGGLARVRVPAATAALIALLGVVCGGLLPRAAQAALPSTELLNELARRLTLPPSCLPACVAIPSLRADLGADQLTLRVAADVQDGGVALPLPGQSGHWLAQTVLVDGALEAALVRDDNGYLWLTLPPGRHTLTLVGSVPDGPSFQVPFPLPPQHLEVVAPGWSVNGARPDGGSESHLIFTRQASAAQGPAAKLEPRALPAFFKVERILRLGLDWRVETQVTRLTPRDSAVALAIPLLPGESVVTPEVRVEDGRVAVNLAAADAYYSWQSVLDKAEQLTLTAPAASEWVETWRADISPLWHARLGGIPVVHHQDEAGQWLPTWQPWPGETVTLALARPDGVAGQQLTIDRSRLALRPAARASEASLEFTLRSSQGGQHTLSLPEAAVLQTISIDGVEQPIRQDGSTLSLPLEPGEHAVSLSWRDDSALGVHLRTPAFSLGAASVNARLDIALPADRWTLFAGGPRLGPAVLFWGVLIVLAGIAYALGRTRYTPLSAWQWLLLAIGLSQVTIAHGLVVVGWLFALAWRSRRAPLASARVFNLVQVLLVLLTLAALSLLFEAIRQGLLGAPDMQIAGNGSSATELHWFQDRVELAHPQAWVVSVPLWCYRGLMLAWALWLAFALLDWLRWGYGAFAQDGLWHASARRAPADGAPAPAAQAPPAG